MSPVAVGVDGCPAGWIAVFRAADDSIGSGVHASVAALVAAFPGDALIAIDVPIGLGENGSRQCDVEARRALGPSRASSVFPAPVRAALHARSHQEACELSERASSKRISIQAYHILARIRETDALFERDITLAERVRETHPELSFHRWNGGALSHSKHAAEGRNARRSLVEARYGDAWDVARAQYLKRDVRDDDLLDAFAALWTAERMTEGRAEPVPSDDLRDRLGRPMRIWS